MNVDKISAITIKVNDMARSLHFYNRLLVLLCYKIRHISCKN
jgi:catechol 2,3-dioxygenase-like lactoylglutathione lyase family enzyme